MTAVAASLVSEWLAACSSPLLQYWQLADSVATQLKGLPEPRARTSPCGWLAAVFSTTSRDLLAQYSITFTGGRYSHLAWL